MRHRFRFAERQTGPSRGRKRPPVFAGSERGKTSRRATCKRLSRRVCRTRSGSLYRLEGDPRRGTSISVAKHGIALDLADPIKLITTKGDGRRPPTILSSLPFAN